MTPMTPMTPMTRKTRRPPADGARPAAAAPPADGERIHKVLARAGLGSRREIERLIAARRVCVNGQPAVAGQPVRPGDRVQIDGGAAIRIEAPVEPLRVLAYNKPAGVVCTRRDPEGRPDVFADLPRMKRGRWINVGRLDINTSGLLLFTNHGELAHRLMHPRYHIDREYAVRIYGEVDRAMLERLRSGVLIEGEQSHFDDITVGEGEGANQWYYCVVQRGRHREVRRLWESQGVQVSRLIRVRFGNVMLPTDLRAGRTVELGGMLLADLCALVGLHPAAVADGTGPRRP
jgi:23S rRNA pseudouridine2605 synthase